MIDLKEAVRLAKKFLTETEGQPEENVEVEEALLARDGKSWSVTLSYFKKITSPNDLQKALGLTGTKAYKRIVIDSKTRNIIGMSRRPFDKSEAA